MATTELKPLILRSNRFLGTVLVEKKLVTVEQLEAANEKLLGHIQNNDLRRANILHILLFEMQIMNEDLYLEAVVEQHGLGLIDLHGCAFRKFADLKFDLAACWATWTVPFDIADDFYLLATAFYPSQPAVKFWQEKYAGSNLLWYATSVRSLQAALERLEQMRAASEKAQAAAKPAAPAAITLKPSRGSKSPIPIPVKTGGSKPPMKVPTPPAKA
jgi:hypothetical protein